MARIEGSTPKAPLDHTLRIGLRSIAMGKRSGQRQRKKSDGRWKQDVRRKSRFKPTPGDCGCLSIILLLRDKIALRINRAWAQQAIPVSH